MGQAGSRYTKWKPKQLDLEAALNLSSFRFLSQKCCLSLTWAAWLAFRESLAFPEQPGPGHVPLESSPRASMDWGGEKGWRKEGRWRRGGEGSLGGEKSREAVTRNLQKNQSLFLLSVDPRRYFSPFLFQPMSWTLFSFKKEPFFSARSGQQCLAEQQQSSSGPFGSQLLSMGF